MQLSFRILVIMMLFYSLGVQANDTPLPKPSMDSTAIFYASDLPVDILSQYERVILEPDNVKPAELLALNEGNARVYAYISIGEILSSRSWYKEIDPSWILGKNRVWDSEVMDLNNSGWQDFILNKLVTPLVEKGYDGLFLDTMDSFQLFAKTDEDRKTQAQALAKLLTNIKTKYPDIKLIANRGFEVIPEIGNLLEAVLAESLYASWDNVKQEFKQTPPEDTSWLLGKLQGIQSEFGMDVIIIDYLPVEQRNEALRVADRIQSLGFVPWISGHALDRIGIGSKNPVPKTFLLLIDSTKETGSPENTPLYLALRKALEKRGYNMRLHDIHTGFPSNSLTGRYAGVISYLNFAKQSSVYQAWLVKQQQEGVLVKGLQPLANPPAKQATGVQQ